MFKMGSHDPFGHMQHKLWQKERPGVKLAIWLSTTKSWESTRLPCMQMECDTPLERSWRELQLYFKPHPDRRFEQEVMALQSCGSPTLAISGLPFGSPRTKKTIWMWASRWGAKNTIWGKVVASPESGSWWISWV